MKPLTANVLILGIGNCLMSDDGIGVHAARLLATDPPPGATAIDMGTDFLSAVPMLEQFPKVLVIDAMDAGEPPGTLYQCRAAAIEMPGLGAGLHEMNLLSLLEFVDPDKRPEIHFLGVQPEVISLGLELSPCLAAVLPNVVKKAREFTATLLQSN